MAQRLQLLITMEPDGSVDLQGPLNQPVVFLGLLELGKASYIAGLTAEAKDEGPRILVGSAAMGAELKRRSQQP